MFVFFGAKNQGRGLRSVNNGIPAYLHAKPPRFWRLAFWRFG